jgi:hypothetical protein
MKISSLFQVSAVIIPGKGALRHRSGRVCTVFKFCGPSSSSPLGACCLYIDNFSLLPDSLQDLNAL